MMLVPSMPNASLAQVQDMLQKAIELEHATIPLYLNAYYSLKPGANAEIGSIFKDIVFQEMQHMALAANILNAIGGQPAIDDPAFLPRYPGGLPFSIGDRQGKRFEAHLEPFSLPLVTNTFMLIEEPDDPIAFPVHPQFFALVQEQTFKTIGDFYRDLRAGLKQEWFTGDQTRQVSRVVQPVRSLADAQAAIDTIVLQGEGTTKSPLGGGGELAHYYRFEEISKQLTLTPDPAVRPQGYRFGPPSIPYDPAGVWPMVKNPNSSIYTVGSQPRVESDLFNKIYSDLLRALHLAFNGQPDHLDAAIGLMFDLKLQAVKLVAMPLGGGVNAAPCFEWVP